VSGQGHGHGHGHVTPRADGARARCGGPAVCPACQREQAVLADRARQESGR
jgi:hypothetical protein